MSLRSPIQMPREKVESTAEQKEDKSSSARVYDTPVAMRTPKESNVDAGIQRLRPQTAKTSATSGSTPPIVAADSKGAKNNVIPERRPSSKRGPPAGEVVAAQPAEILVAPSKDTAPEGKGVDIEVAVIAAEEAEGSGGGDVEEDEEDEVSGDLFGSEFSLASDICSAEEEALSRVDAQYNSEKQASSPIAVRDNVGAEARALSPGTQQEIEGDPQAGVEEDEDEEEGIEEEYQDVEGEEADCEDEEVNHVPEDVRKMILWWKAIYSDEEKLFNTDEDVLQDARENVLVVQKANEQRIKAAHEKVELATTQVGLSEGQMTNSRAKMERLRARYKLSVRVFRSTQI